MSPYKKVRRVLNGKRERMLDKKARPSMIRKKINDLSIYYNKLSMTQLKIQIIIFKSTTQSRSSEINSIASVVEDENESQHAQHAVIMNEINNSDNLEELSDWILE
ncbi:hypothetical protein QTP88_028821 [Uroleucon formosanum]